MVTDATLTEEVRLRNVQRIERQPLAYRVAENIRELILLEQLPPDATITERDMAEALGVSRTPLREALRILASEGLITIPANRKPRVANPPLHSIIELLQIQGALEGLAGEIACKHATDAELAYIEKLHSEMVSISETSPALDFFSLDMEFHKSIVAASGNQSLVEVHTSYNNRLYRARFISSRRPLGRPNTLKQHEQIVKCLLRRDEASVRAALRNHLETTGENIAEAQRETPSSRSNVAG